MDEMTVLVIDDEQSALTHLEKLLSRKYRVLATPSTEEAIQLLNKDNSIAVVVCDQKMAGMSGIELLNHAKTINPKGVRILMTAFDDCAIEAVNQSEIFKYIQKPLDIELLVSYIDEGLKKYAESTTTVSLSEKSQQITSLLDERENRIFFANQYLKSPMVTINWLSMMLQSTELDFFQHRLISLLREIVSQTLCVSDRLFTDNDNKEIHIEKIDETLFSFDSLVKDLSLVISSNGGKPNKSDVSFYRGDYMPDYFYSDKQMIMEMVGQIASVFIDQGCSNLSFVFNRHQIDTNQDILKISLMVDDYSLVESVKTIIAEYDESKSVSEFEKSSLQTLAIQKYLAQCRRGDLFVEDTDLVISIPAIYIDDKSDKDFYEEVVSKDRICSSLSFAQYIPRKIGILDFMDGELIWHALCFLGYEPKFFKTVDEAVNFDIIFVSEGNQKNANIIDSLTKSSAAELVLYGERKTLIKNHNSDFLHHFYPPYRFDELQKILSPW